MSRLNLATSLTVLIMVVGATVGETLISAAMNGVGDLDQIRHRDGLPGAIKAVLGSPLLFAGIGCMAISFFSLLMALSGADVSLVVPSTNSLTFIATAVSAKFFLKENVDRRRWFAAIFVAAGVFLIAR